MNASVLDAFHKASAFNKNKDMYATISEIKMVTVG